MMGHRQVEQAALFYEFSLEEQIPAIHLLRSIDRLVDIEQVRRDLALFYSSISRPSGGAQGPEPARCVATASPMWVNNGGRNPRRPWSGLPPKDGVIGRPACR
jgi:hypothetical protein